MAYQSLNPATGKLLKTFVELSDKQLEEKLAMAEKCFKSWKFTPLGRFFRSLERLFHFVERVIPSVDW